MGQTKPNNIKKKRLKIWKKGKVPQKVKRGLRNTNKVEFKKFGSAN
jgi:hypothetical protein